MVGRSLGVAMLAVLGLVVAGCGGGSSPRYDEAKVEACIRARPEFVATALPQPARRPLSVQFGFDMPLPPDFGVGKGRLLEVYFTEAGESRSTSFVQLLFMPDE